jgi:hypothetical protein
MNMRRHSGSDRALAGLTYLLLGTDDNIRGDGRLRERYPKCHPFGLRNLQGLPRRRAGKQDSLTTEL